MKCLPQKKLGLAPSHSTESDEYYPKRHIYTTGMTCKDSLMIVYSIAFRLSVTSLLLIYALHDFNFTSVWFAKFGQFYLPWILHSSTPFFTPKLGAADEGTVQCNVVQHLTNPLWEKSSCRSTLHPQLLLDAFSRNRLSRRVKPYFECFNRMIYLNSFKPLLWSQCVLQDEKFEGVLSRLCPYFVFLSPLRAVFLQSPVQYFCPLSAFQQPPKPDLVVTSFRRRWVTTRQSCSHVWCISQQLDFNANPDRGFVCWS